MIKLAIDGSRIRRDMTGAGRYGAGILPALDVVAPDVQFIVYGRAECSIEPPSSRWTIKCDTHPLWSRLPLTFWIHYRLGELVMRDRPDVFWGPNSLLPKGLNAAIPCVDTVLDFIHVLLPETLPPVTRYAHRKWKTADAMSAARCVVISKGTADRMRALLGREADGIAYPAVPKMPPVPDADTAERSLDVLGVRRPFLLTVGTRLPRKNLASAVAAVRLLKERGKLTSHSLVMAGAEAWNQSNRAYEKADSTPWIRPLGFVDDATLAILYSYAAALLFPSLYEGFGMPVIEARAHGCRVVTTDSPELREAGGDEAVYTDTSPQGIAAGIEAALENPAPRPRFVEHSWRDAAEVMARVVRDAASKARAA